LRLSRFTLKVWECTNTPHSCILQSNIRLYRFGYVGESMGFDIPVTNLIIVELHDGFYVKEEVAIMYPQAQIELPSSYCSPSYSLSQFQTILKTKEKIRRAKEANTKLKNNLLNKLIEQRELLEKRQKYNLLKHSVRKLQKQVVLEKTLRRERIDLLQELRELPQLSQVSKALFEILDSKQRLQSQIRELNESKKEVSEYQWALEARQSFLIRDMRGIFTITQTADRHKSLCINGVRLPNTDFTGCPEETIATGLGLVCQAIFMLSRWLDVPLRYPMKPGLSRSTISDHISSFSTSTNSFPLYARGVDRNRFEYAVFLLNKNLEQLLNSQNLEIITLRHTLPNLQFLLFSRGKGASRRRRANSTPRSNPNLVHIDE